MTHDPQSFIVDTPLVQPTMMVVVVRGVFKQAGPGGRSSPLVRNFVKSMVIVPAGAGLCVSNEQLYINVATPEQVKGAIKNMAAPSDDFSGLDDAKRELILRFQDSSKMLPKFCRLCLERNDWHYDKSAEMFLELQRTNKIPPEYFGIVE